MMGTVHPGYDAMVRAFEGAREPAQGDKTAAGR